AEELPVELSETALGIAFVPVVLRRELLGVETPAFGVRRSASEQSVAAIARQAFGFLLRRNLEMMARDALVVDQRAHADDVELGARERRPEDARPRAIARGRGVVRGGRLFGERWFAPDLDGCLRRDVEHQLGALLGVAQ